MGTSAPEDPSDEKASEVMAAEASGQSPGEEPSTPWGSDMVAHKLVLKKGKNNKKSKTAKCLSDRSILQHDLSHLQVISRLPSLKNTYSF